MVKWMAVPVVDRGQTLWWSSGALAAGAAAAALAVGAYFHRRLLKERIKAFDLSQLRSALDQIDIAIALIDPDLRARFLNRTYRRIFRVPDALADGRPSLTVLLEHKYDQRVYEIPSDKHTYVAERLALIQSGDENPIDLRLTNGDVMRFRCNALADGGWMLNYGNVSDLVRTADELAELARTDTLTGISNRRFFFAGLEDEWARYQRYGKSLSVLAIDLDAFKSINDAFGHHAGDEVLKRVATLCMSLKRKPDIFARLGGEEFGFILPETNLDDAARFAERLRAAVAADRGSGVAGLTNTTVSIGVAEAASTMSNPADLIRKADKALYVAKRGGRNRVATVAVDLVRATSVA